MIRRFIHVAVKVFCLQHPWKAKFCSKIIKYPSRSGWILSMQIFRIGHGEFRGLVGVRCDDETTDIFQSAKTVAFSLLGLTSPSEVSEEAPTEIQKYLKSVGHGDYPWQYLKTPDATGLGLGSNKRKCSRAAFLALALDRVSRISPNQVPEILRTSVLALSQASDLEASTEVWAGWQRPQAEKETLEDFQQLFESAWQECEQWLYGFKANSMPNILELQHVEALRNSDCRIPRTIAHKILMAARGLMMTELQSSREDVIYKSLANRPWQGIVAGAGDTIRRDLVGPGIKEFRLEMRRYEKCPYTKDPMAVFVAVREDGTKAIHHPHAHRDEQLRFEGADGVKYQPPPTKDEIVRAFRLATNWSVQKRWTAFQAGVFQGILRRFKRHFRPEGFQVTDFQKGTRVEAWELAPPVKYKFVEFLQNGCQQDESSGSDGSDADAEVSNVLQASADASEEPCDRQNWQVSSPPTDGPSGSWDSTRWDTDAWWRWQNSWDSSWRSGSWRTESWHESDARSWQSWDRDEDEDLDNLHREALTNLGFSNPHNPQETNMQSAMIREFLRNEVSGSGRILASLDPARSETAERTYANLIREIDVSDLRYSHDSISKKFMHGEHKGQSIETLAYDMWYGRLQTRDVKPLVGVTWKGAVWVICGNRRCRALKTYVEWLGPRRSDMPKARVILHDFPRVPGIPNQQVRCAFILKAIESMSTRSDGLDVEVGRFGRTSRWGSAEFHSVGIDSAKRCVLTATSWHIWKAKTWVQHFNIAPIAETCGWHSDRSWTQLLLWRLMLARQWFVERGFQNASLDDLPPSCLVPNGAGPWCDAPRDAREAQSIIVEYRRYD